MAENCTVVAAAIDVGREPEPLLTDEERANDDDDISLLCAQDDLSGHTILPIYNTTHKLAPISRRDVLFKRELTRIPPKGYTDVLSLV
jgi:hypothetical protein